MTCPRWFPFTPRRGHRAASQHRRFRSPSGGQKLPRRGEVRAVLRLIAADKVRVSDEAGGRSARRPTESTDLDDPAADLAIRAFSGPLLVQAGGIAAATLCHLRAPSVRR